MALLDVVRTLAESRRSKIWGLSVSDFPVERPKSREHGDWSSNAALRYAKRVGMASDELASAIASALRALPDIESVEVAGPGFVNIWLAATATGAVVQQIVQAGRAYGTATELEGQKINLEFVSANPTGPIHLGGTRWAAVGDALGRILSSQGAEVTREYYFNDHGAQIDRFVRSLVASHEGAATPDDGYAGDYVDDIAELVAETYSGDVDALDASARHEVFRDLGVGFMFDQIKQSLRNFGVTFDVYFHEDELHRSGAVDRALTRLRALGQLYESDGAVWLRSTAFGDDKDRVVVKSDGNTAYLAGDLAYYLDKRQRGFNRCIMMLGADHHGYIGRLMAGCAAFGDEPGVNLQILIGQMVNLVKDGKPVRMSKRAGAIVTIGDLVDAVGVDAARYALSRSSTDSNLDVDLDLLRQRTNDNPVYYVQYAHARTANVARNASAAGITRDDFAPELLTHESESALLGGLQEYPRVVASAATLREPHRIARSLEELAGLYHRWYHNCRVVPRHGEPVEPVHRTRLWLNDATGQVLRNGLELLGVGAPDRM